MSGEAIGRFDHIGIAVNSIESARHFFEGSLGATFRSLHQSRDGSFRFAVFDLGGFTIELLEPLDAEGFVAKFLKRRGEGVHHITLQIPNLQRTVAALERRGIHVVDKELDNPARLDAYISPRSAHGILFQLGGTMPPLNNRPFWVLDAGD
jgi:methylmalonyl-CoA epimerase